MIRTFLAIELPGTLKDRLAALQTEFAQYTSLLKWPAPDLIHITVRFIGGVPESRMGAVMTAAQEAAGRCPPFRLDLAGLGAFPSIRQPRVVWVGLEHDAGYNILHGLFSNVEQALTAQGFPAENRPYSPHITLGRTRDTISAVERRELGTRLAEVAERAVIVAGISVRELTVMRSDLSRSGPTYTAMARYPLAGVAVAAGGDAAGRVE
jgi:2'-5' RNA ligase